MEVGGGGGVGGVCIWDKLCEKWIKLKEFGWLGWGRGGDGFRCPMCGLLLNRRRWEGGVA